jgi:pilus assembly protein Flp/PilA
MKTLLKKLLRLIRDEAGPTAVEYAMLLMLLILVCLTGITAIGQLTATRFERSSTSIQDVIDSRP